MSSPRRLLLVLLGLAALLALPVLLPAGEGEWLPEQLADLDFTELRAAGLQRGDLSFPIDQKCRGKIADSIVGGHGVCPSRVSFVQVYPGEALL